MTLNPGDIIAERYEIIEKLGTGGMAKVYRAKDEKLDRFVTFKVMREDFVNDSEFLARFQVEARAAASLSNQNIVNVYDVGQEDDIHYIVMEYIDGVTLKDLIKRRAPFENDEILGVSIQIGIGLMHAHENGIVHRDIKPQNIMVTTNGNIKVMDFGIARAASAGTMTTSGNAMGSVHYFSPEQARGSYVDFKTDIYSLGLIMYEMATGKMPFDGDTSIAVALKQINDPLPDLKTVNPKLSESVVKIILKATEKLSSQRYQATMEMVNDLKRAITNSSGDFVTKVDEEDLLESPTVILGLEDMEGIKKDIIANEETGYGTETEVEYDQDDGVEKIKIEKTSEKKVIIAAVLTSLAIILVIGAIISYFVVTKIPKLPDPVEVPYLVGKTIEDASAEVKKLGIIINPIEIYDDEIRKGDIISQSVKEDEKLYPGQTINVIVSLGTNKFEVPDVTGKEVMEAFSVFDQDEYKSLKPDDKFVYSEDVTQGFVVSQEPEAGKMVEAGTVVTINVSKGPEFKDVIVPDVVGDTEGEAKSKLEEYGLAPGPVTYADSATVPSGEVIAQTVEPGDTVSINAPVGIVISKGKPEATKSPESTPEPTQISKTITIDVPPGSVPEGVETVNVEIIKISQEGNVSYYDENVPVSNLPYVVPVTGDYEADFQVYIRDVSSPETIYYRGG